MLDAKSPTLAARFWSKVDKSAGPDACWPWTGGRASFGYGRIQTGTWQQQAVELTHRVSWELHAGRSLRSGEVVRHACDNPPCVNPAHLLVGTQTDNVADMTSRRRHWLHNREACKNGHPWDEENTAYSKTARGGVQRRCRACSRERYWRKVTSDVASAG